MTSRILLAPLCALAACSSQAPTNSSTADAAPAANEAAEAPAAPPAGAAGEDSHATPRPGELKTFADWTVGCDNARRCTMASLVPENGAEPSSVAITLTRAPGPAGAIDIAITETDDAMLAPVAVMVDGRRFAVADGLSGDAAVAIARAMATGKTMAIRGTKSDLGTISLAGVAAAQRYMDAEQGRVDTQTALVARGPKPAEAVPAASALPVVAAHTITPTTLDGVYVSSLRRQAGCGDDPMAQQQDVQAFTLGGGKTLALVPCSVGAYNVYASAFVVANGRAQPAATDAPGDLSDNPDQDVPQLVNAALDGLVLTSYAKGRGLGDCGVRQSLAWDGERLRLTEQAEMGDCRGNPEFITTWRTKVVPR